MALSHDGFFHKTTAFFPAPLLFHNSESPKGWQPRNKNYDFVLNAFFSICTRMQNTANVNHFDTTRPNDGKQHHDYTIPRMNIPRMKGKNPGTTQDVFGGCHPLSFQSKSLHCNVVITVSPDPRQTISECLSGRCTRKLTDDPRTHKICVASLDTLTFWWVRGFLHIVNA